MDKPFQQKEGSQGRQATAERAGTDAMQQGDRMRNEPKRPDHTSAMAGQHVWAPFVAVSQDPL